MLQPFKSVIYLNLLLTKFLPPILDKRKRYDDKPNSKPLPPLFPTTRHLVWPNSVSQSTTVQHRWLCANRRSYWSNPVWKAPPL